MPRELTLSPQELIHPESIGGARTWVPGRGLDALADAMREFDPRLTLAFHGRDKRWEVWRYEGGEYNLVMRSRPGMGFPANVLEELRSRDVRNGYDPHAHVEAHNARVDADLDRKTDDEFGVGAEKLAWALRKDIGHLY